MNNPQWNQIESKNEFNYLNFVTEDIKTIDVSVVLNEIEKDNTLKQVREFLQTGWPKEIEEIPYKRRNNELVLENNIVMWEHRVVIPETLRKNLLEELHVGHMGAVKIKALVRSYFWWPRSYRDIELITKSCELCIKHSGDPCRAPLTKWE